MPLLQIDLDGADALAADLLSWRTVADQVAADVLIACARASVPPVGAESLFRISATSIGAASAVMRAAAAARSFRLPPLLPVGAALLDRRRAWHDVYQCADHNTYRYGTVDDFQRKGSRTHEFDLHVGEPTDVSWQRFTESLAPWIDPGPVLRDSLDNRGSMPGDWHVYHWSLDAHSAYSSLSAALDDVAAGDDLVPVTIFLDLKDPLEGNHGVATLDALLRDRLGDRLFTPGDLLDHTPGAVTLAESVASGWPTVAELDDAVLVVLTAEVDAYRRRPPRDASAFVATRPTLADLAEANIVVYNDRADRLDDREIALIRGKGALLRAWGPWAPAADHANYDATDNAVDDC